MADPRPNSSPDARPLCHAQCRPSGRYQARDRVRKRSEFLRIQDAGQRVVSPGFVFMLQRPSGPVSSERGPRLGITASRRIGNAAVRNRAKRVVREAFRAVRGSWPTADVVVIVRQALNDRKLADVVAEWVAAHGRIHRRFAQLAEVGAAPDVAVHPERPAVAPADANRRRGK